jgi:oxaloacetate decarboxylase beta subunit
LDTLITILQAFGDTIVSLWNNSGFANMGLNSLAMLIVSFVLLYLAIVKKFEPLLLLPIAFGMMLSNLPMGGIFHMEFFDPDNIARLGYEKGTLFATDELFSRGGLLDYLYLGIKLGIYPPLIFLGIGAMTDFGPLLANPKSLLLGAAAQFGIFLAFFLALFLGFSPQQAGAIGIIGGADGPTAIFVAKTLAPELLGAIAVAAYAYMALVPIIQPPIMRLLTTRRERQTVMAQLRPVSRTERIIFPIAVTILVALIIPDALTLVGMLMLGNLLKESGVCERLVKTAANELMNIVTIFLGISVGATATAEYFLTSRTLMILGLGVVAFIFGTAGGVLIGKLMYVLTKGKVNPLIGSAGVSAVPMAARVSQKVGQEENPANFLLMHAMGPNVAGVIGSAVAAGILLMLLK